VHNKVVGGGGHPDIRIILLKMQIPYIVRLKIPLRYSMAVNSPTVKNLHPDPLSHHFRQISLCKLTVRRMRAIIRLAKVYSLREKCGKWRQVRR